MMKLNLTLKCISTWMKEFLNCFAWKMILLNILQNVPIYLNILFCYDNFLKFYVSILQAKSNFLVLHNFTN